MISRPFAITLAIVSALAVAHDVGAQSSSPLSLEATVGYGRGLTGGEYHGGRSGIAADALLAMRIRPMAGGTLVGGLSAGAQASGTSTSMCYRMATGGCMPSFPGFSTFTPSVGWESAGAGLRAMIGPAVVQARGGALGVQGRLDLATAILRRMSAVVSVRPTLIPDYEGDMVGLLAIGAGLRFR